MKAGAQIYADECSGCHTSGKGTPGLFPSLNGTPMVQQADATTLIRVVLRGALSVATNAAPTGPEMPAFGWILNDDQAADVLTYIRNSWGNSAGAVNTLKRDPAQRGSTKWFQKVHANLCGTFRNTKVAAALAR